MPAAARYCTWLLLLILAVPALGQAPAEDSWTGTFRVLVQGRQVGSEQIRVTRDASGTTIRSSGDITSGGFSLREAEVVYRADGGADRLSVDATIRQQPLLVRTAVRDGRAVSTVTQGGTTSEVAHAVAPDTVLLPPNVYGATQGLAFRLIRMEPGATLPIYVAPQAEVQATLSRVAIERLQTAAGQFDVRRHVLEIANPGQPVEAIVWVEVATGHLVRYSAPAAGLDVVREDLTSVFTREVKVFRENDQTLLIPAPGFNLGATVSRPAGRTAPLPGTKNVQRLPAIVLVGGSAGSDRDSVAYGVPVMGQLAGLLADAGFVVVRYDKRGVGQSGGRAESATLADYAEDLLTVVRWVRKQKDVDGRRVAVVGHSEGGAVALLAASRSGDIQAVVAVAAPGVQGSELVLEQQRRALEALALPDEEKQQRVQMQKQIMSAVLTGQGWEGVPDAMRKQADTPYFKSLLAFDPAVVVRKVRQPLLIVHGALDRQVPASNAEALKGLASQRKRDVSALVLLPGINHLLVPAASGDRSGDDGQTDAVVSPDVARVIVDWLGTLSP